MRTIHRIGLWFIIVGIITDHHNTGYDWIGVVMFLIGSIMFILIDDK